MRCSHQRERLLGTSSIQCLETNSVHAGQVFYNLYCSLFLSLDLHGILLFFLIHSLSLYTILFICFISSLFFFFFLLSFLVLLHFIFSFLLCFLHVLVHSHPSLSILIFYLCIKILSKYLQHACNEGCKCLF